MFSLRSVIEIEDFEFENIYCIGAIYHSSVSLTGPLKLGKISIQTEVIRESRYAKCYSKSH